MKKSNTAVRKTPGTRSRKTPSNKRLTLDGILTAALELIDEAGLEEFSVRNLAKRMGVYPTAIYWHVTERNLLLANVLDFAFKDVLPGRSSGSWQVYLKQLFRSYRDTLRSHPNLAPLIVAQMVSNSGVNLEFVETILVTLRRAGFSGEAMVGAYNSVIAALVGFTAQELAPLPSESTGPWQQAMMTRLNTIDRGQYPVLSEHLGDLMNNAFILRWQNGVDRPLDRSFEFFLAAFISGLEQAPRTTNKELPKRTN